MEVCTLFQCNFYIPVISAQYDQCDGPAYQHLTVTSCTMILHSIFLSEKAPIPKLSEKKISILSIQLFISSVPKISARTCNPLFGVLDQRVRRPGKAHTSNYPSENTFTSERVKNVRWAAGDYLKCIWISGTAFFQEDSHRFSLVACETILQMSLGIKHFQELPSCTSFQPNQEQEDSNSDSEKEDHHYGTFLVLRGSLIKYLFKSICHLY